MQRPLTMKAIVQEKYGSADDLELREVLAPSPCPAMTKFSCVSERRRFIQMYGTWLRGDPISFG